MGNEQENNLERMSKFETKLEYIGDMISKLDAKIEKLYSHFVTRDMLDEKIKSVEKDIHVLREELQSQKEDKRNHKSALPLWIAIVPTVVMVVVEIINLTHK